MSADYSVVSVDCSTMLDFVCEFDCESSAPGQKLFFLRTQFYTYDITLQQLMDHGQVGTRSMSVQMAPWNELKLGLVLTLPPSMEVRPVKALQPSSWAPALVWIHTSSSNQANELTKSTFTCSNLDCLGFLDSLLQNLWRWTPDSGSSMLQTQWMSWPRSRHSVLCDNFMSL